ncbi:acetyl-coenzyme A synthetase: cytoplasmic-like isoform X1 [Dinothrombium tinctorium]|uniref:Acetyl-coenzyme A synthetase n=1 Tax=Dinothrombium tinctorium TaxID=1965070 RepID=A0A3S3QW33_9ACAR|nr:acetyl-coenzyme A synthetase: cytoplasmic-like isoform X1 [Dinothrombium tinctorium]
MAISEEMNGEETLIYYPSEKFRENAHISNIDVYRRMYKHSVEDPEGFWGEISKEFFFKSGPKGPFLKYNLDIYKGPIEIKWMEGASTNACYNVVDRIVEKGLGDRLAYIWQICKFSNVLKSKGIKKGDRVAIYMPVTIELVVAMLSCARIGAIHSVVFAGFSGDAIAERVIDCNCKLLVTCDGVYRGSKYIPLKEIVDDAVFKCGLKKHKLVACIVYHHLKCFPPAKYNEHKKDDKFEFNNNDYPRIPWNPEIDVWWHEVMDKADDHCDPVWVDAEDPLFILYTSGSTGKPKGVLHTTAGYMIYAATTFKYVFNFNGGDVFFCTADLGWITGHTVNVYGSLANGATIVLFDGTPFYPDPSRLWQIVDRHSVTTFYTAPTAVRSLMKYGDGFVLKHSRNSLKLLGTAGEPINAEAWNWYYRVVGNSRCPIVDTFWQTETAAPMLTGLPGCIAMKPGSASFPFFGVVPAILNEEGKELHGPCEGYLVFKEPWPAIIRTVDGNHKRFEVTYFHRFPGYYCTGDSCRRDEDGYYWITGRVDDLLNVSGHLLSTAEVEACLVDHKAIAETAAVATPHAIKGECIYCFVVLKNGYEFTRDLELQLKQEVRSKRGAIATPEVIHVVSALPKTRSGKIMRRLLRKVAADDRDLGDVSSLADDSIIEELFATRSLYVEC